MADSDELDQLWAEEGERRFRGYKAGKIEVFAGDEVHRQILEQPDSRSEAEWLAEIERRARAAIDGAPGLTWEEAKARIQQRLAER